MYKVIEIGKYFAPGDMSSSYNDVKKFSNLIAGHDEISCYTDSTKIKNRSDLKISDELVYLHGSSTSTSYPYFEFGDNNGLPLIIQFNMRFTKIAGELGDKDWIFSYDDTVSNGAIGVRGMDIIDRKLKICFVDHTGSIVCPITEGMQDGGWFKVNLTYYNNNLNVAINDRTIGSVPWPKDLQDKFQIQLKGDMYYADISDITISRVCSVLAPDKPFDIDFNVDTIVNGATTVTAKVVNITQE